MRLEKSKLSLARYTILVLGLSLIGMSFTDGHVGLDGASRLHVAKSMWFDGSFKSTWFDFGNILTTYLMFPVAKLFESLSLTTQGIDLETVLIHSSFFIATTTAAMFYFATIYGILKNRPIMRLLLCFILNPSLFGLRYALIETNLCTYYSLLFVLAHARIVNNRRVWYQNAAILFITFLAIAAKAAVAVPLMFLGVAFIWGKDWKASASMFVGAMGGVGCFFWWNYTLHGDPFHYMHGQSGFDAPLFESLYALLVSPGMGLIFFAPLSLFGFIKLWKLCEQRKDLAFWIPLMSFTVVHIILFSKWWSYNGGLAFGPRFQLPILAILVCFGMLWVSELPALKRFSMWSFFVILSSYIHGNGILFPAHFQFNKWNRIITDKKIHLPLKEGPSAISFEDRVSLFDPFYADLTGNFSEFFSRMDMWNISFLDVAPKRLITRIHVKPDQALNSLQMISQSYNPFPWGVNRIEIRQDKRKIGFKLGKTGVENPEAATDGNPHTFAKIMKTEYGSRFQIDLDETLSDPFVIDLDHDIFTQDQPFKLILQKTGGGYFDGFPWDHSYIPFEKQYIPVFPVVGVIWEKMTLLLLGVFMILLAFTKLNIHEA